MDAAAGPRPARGDARPRFGLRPASPVVPGEGTQWAAHALWHAHWHVYLHPSLLVLRDCVCLQGPLRVRIL